MNTFMVICRSEAVSCTGWLLWSKNHGHASSMEGHEVVAYAPRSLRKSRFLSWCTPRWILPLVVDLSTLHPASKDGAKSCSCRLHSVPGQECVSRCQSRSKGILSSGNFILRSLNTIGQIHTSYLMKEKKMFRLPIRQRRCNIFAIFFSNNTLTPREWLRQRQ